MTTEQRTEQTLSLPCRYYRVYTDPDVPCVESNFHYVERTLPLPLEQTALVLVDVWSTHYIDSWLKRAQEITQTKIIPLLEAARRAGMTIIHGPSPYIADKHIPSPPGPEVTTTPKPPDWPPAAFRGIYRSGEYAEFGRNQEPRLDAAMERYKTELDMAPTVRPLDGELLIHTGDQMHRLLAERKILHLIYAGFAANWCLLGRDYAIMAMNSRGYNVILVRDATTGIEFHDTIANQTATAMTVQEIETKYGWSTTTGDFIQACRSVR